MLEQNSKNSKSLPDVAEELNLDQFPALDWVGMKEIEVPLWVDVEGERVMLAARAEAKVSLDKKSSRGIHMSRLYMITQRAVENQNLSFAVLERALGEFLQSHQDLSSRAFLSFKFDLPLSRKALKSDNRAWREYPVVMTIEKTDQLRRYLEVTVTYSSTCPASAALSRQLIQENFKKNFAGQNLSFEEIHQWLGSTQGISATPHAQRSLGRIKIELQNELSAEALVDLIEEALQTPVQAAVKREDEQEFALRNGQNLMFCEDAARRVKKALDAQAQILDYVAELNHVESLHPHNAVSLVTKGRRLSGF